MANINIKTLIGNGEMANDHIFTEGPFEWFKSEEDGYIYTRNTNTGRNTRYNAEGQNGKRISDTEYFAKCNEALDRNEAKVISEEVKPVLKLVGGAVEFHEAAEAHEEAAPVEESSSTTPATKTEEKPKKKARKAKKNAAFRTTIDGTEITLTDKQVDFIKHLPDSNFWEDGVNSTLWVDVLCDEIGGQFEGKPMTVGAMISTICEKGLGIRTKNRVNGRKATAFALTGLGKVIAAELGLK